MKLRTSSSQEEGCDRSFSVVTRRFLGDRRVAAVECERDGEPFELAADLVLLAMGFTGPQSGGIVWPPPVPPHHAGVSPIRGVNDRRTVARVGSFTAPLAPITSSGLRNDGTSIARTTSPSPALVRRRRSPVTARAGTSRVGSVASSLAASAFGGRFLDDCVYGRQPARHQAIAAAREALGEKSFALAGAWGARLTLDQAVHFALTPD